MSEFMEEHSVARLIGAPPGYVGYQEGGQLTEALRRKPYAVVLLDEIEKAHNQVFDIFLQLYDEGRLTDAQGHLVDGKQAVFIMTSNVATDLLGRGRTGFPVSDDEESTTSLVMDELESAFSPEFLGRVDKVVVFNALNKENIRDILHLKLKSLQEQLKQRHSIVLHVEPSAVEFLGEEGYDKKYGARHLERAIEDWIAVPLSDEILDGISERLVHTASQNGTCSDCGETIHRSERDHLIAQFNDANHKIEFVSGTGRSLDQETPTLQK
jgi:ATP-dependent Clp protease ATP-binding subunit ClpA